MKKTLLLISVCSVVDWMVQLYSAADKSPDAAVIFLEQPAAGS